MLPSPCFFCLCMVNDRHAKTRTLAFAASRLCSHTLDTVLSGRILFFTFSFALRTGPLAKKLGGLVCAMRNTVVSYASVEMGFGHTSDVCVLEACAFE